MTVLGFALLLAGAALMVAEAHAPGGVFGVAGGLGLVGGGIVLIGALGGGDMLAIPVAVGIGGVAVGWPLRAPRRAASAQRGRIQSRLDALCGRAGVLRQRHEPAGQVFVEGALWRAQHDWGARENAALQE